MLLLLCNLIFQFQEQEKKKYKAEQQRLDDKHTRQLDELRGGTDSAKRELEQLQNEKRKFVVNVDNGLCYCLKFQTNEILTLMYFVGALLTQHEELKLKELDETFSQHLKSFKGEMPVKLEVTLK